MHVQLAQDMGGVAIITAAIIDPLLSSVGLDADAAEVGKPAIRASSTAQQSQTHLSTAQHNTVVNSTPQHSQKQWSQP